MAFLSRPKGVALTKGGPCGETRHATRRDDVSDVPVNRFHMEVQHTSLTNDKQLENNNVRKDKFEDLNSLFMIQTKILRNSWNKKQNFMTIQVGEKDSVKSNMGVVNSDNSLVGITYTTTDHFSTVISLINTNLMISAKIKNQGHYGSLIWDGKHPNTMQLNDIPKHAKVKIGDTIVTSGYSNILPANINIGVITKYKPEKNTNFLNISIDLFTDFTNIQSAYVVNPMWKFERAIIEKNLNK